MSESTGSRWLRPTLVLVPFILAVLCAYVWSIAIAFVVGLAAYAILRNLMPFIGNERSRWVADIGVRNVTRRRRHSTIALAGLLVASTVVTSAFVVGDSLEATIEHRAVNWLGATDIVIAGSDPLTRQPILFDERLAILLEENLSDHGDIDGLVSGAFEIASVQNNLTSLGEAVVGWWSMNLSQSRESDMDSLGDDGWGWSKMGDEDVAINRVLSEAIDAESGDVIEVSWTEIDPADGVVRRTVNLTITRVVDGPGAEPNGPDEPSLFVPLQFAQSIRGTEGLVERIVLSAQDIEADDPGASNRLARDALAAMDAIVTASDAGVVMVTSESTLSFRHGDLMQTFDENFAAALSSRIEDEAVQATQVEVVAGPIALLHINGVEYLSGIDHAPSVNGSSEAPSPIPTVVGLIVNGSDGHTSGSLNFSGVYQDGDVITLTGLAPTILGLDRELSGNVTGGVPSTLLKAIVPASLEVVVVANITEVRETLLIPPGKSSAWFVMVEEGSLNATEWQFWLDEVTTLASLDLEVTEVKVEAFESAEEIAGDYSKAFLIFGSFTVTAGMVLAGLVLLLIIDERARELGALRTIGLQKREIRELVAVESILLSLVASIIGCVIGAGIGWLLLVGLWQAWSGVVQFELVFSVASESLLLGISAGVLASWLSLEMTLHRLQGKDIIAVIRGHAADQSRDVSHSRWVLSFLLFIIGLLGIWATGRITSWEADLVYVQRTFLGLIVCCTSTWFLLQLLRRRTPSAPRRVQGNQMRFSLAAGAILSILWAWDPFEFDVIRVENPPAEYSFVLLGLTGIAALTVLVSVTLPLFRSALAGTVGRRGWVLRTALSRPERHAFRTGAQVGIFALVVFGAVILTGFVVQFNDASEAWVEDGSGSYQLLVSGTTRDPLLEGVDDDVLNTSNLVDGTTTLSYRRVEVHDLSENWRRRPLRGIDADLVNSGGFPLSHWHRGFGSTPEDIWALVLADDRYAIVEHRLYAPLVDEVGRPRALLGEELKLQLSEDHTRNTSVIVVGVLEPGAAWTASGVLVNGDLATSLFETRPTRMLVKTESALSSSELENLRDILEANLSHLGHDVEIIEDEIHRTQGVVLGVLRVFEGYLAIGLLVGAASLAMVALRSVSERIRENGVFRAMGVTRSRLVGLHTVELSYIASLGLCIGMVAALVFHIALHDLYWADEMRPLIIPWTSMAAIAGISLLIAGLATLPPVLSASKVDPAEALRLVEG